MIYQDRSSSPPARQLLRDAVGMWSFAIGPFCAAAMLTVVIPILPNIAKLVADGSAASLWTQLLVAAPMFGLVLGGLSATLIFSRFTVRTVFLAMLTAYGVLGAAGLVAGPTLLIVSRALIGFVAACIGAASTAFIGARVPPERYPRVLGLQMAGCSIVAILAMIASGRIADIYGWRFSFAIFPLVSVLVLIAALWGERATDDRKLVPPVAPSRESFRLVASLWPLFLFVVAINITAFTTNSQASFVLAAEGVATASSRAGVMGINQLMIVLAAIAFPWVRLLAGSRAMPALILTVMGGGLIALGLSHGLVPAAISLAVLGIGNGLLFPLQSSLLLQRAAPGVRAQAAGIMTASQFLADAINPLLLVPVIGLVGLKPTIAGVGGAAIVGAGVAYFHNGKARTGQDAMGLG